MTELKIAEKQLSSVQDIEVKTEHHASLSQFDIKRLFAGPKFSKFQLMDIKMQTFFCKREKAQFFIRKLQSWNQRILQQENFPNIRSQFILMEFIFSSIKRISLMKQSEVDKQLQLLYSWFLNKGKNSIIFNQASMPQNKQKNQYYNVAKSFKTNPALIIDQYRRPMYFLCNKQANQFQHLAHPKHPKNNLHGNFLTELQQNKNKKNCKEDGQQQLKCFFVTKLQKQIREEQMRRYLEKKQIQEQQWAFKLRKQRLAAEGTKNYNIGSFKTSLRTIKSSQGQRQKKDSQIIESMKRMRVQTSLEKRSLKKMNSFHKTHTNIIQLNEVGRFGLLNNPFQIKIKNKKKLRIQGKSKTNSKDRI